MTQLACQTITWGPRLQEDYPSVFREVQAIGYAGVETNFGVLRANLSRLPALQAETGLKVVAAHLGMADVDKALADPDQEAAVKEVLRTTGAPFLLVSDRPHEDVDAYRVMGQTLTEFSRRLADLPVTLCYHNHRHEVEGDLERTAVLVDAMRSDRLGLAVDFGWVLQAGTDPARVVAQFRDRIRYVHIKDARNGQWTELGRGQLPIAQVFSAIVPLNLPWWTAEQDTTERTAQDSARENYQVLRQQLEQG